MYAVIIVDYRGFMIIIMLLLIVSRIKSLPAKTFSFILKMFYI